VLLSSRILWVQETRRDATAQVARKVSWHWLIDRAATSALNSTINGIHIELHFSIQCIDLVYRLPNHQY
jgi:hypothetical protein